MKTFIDKYKPILIEWGLKLLVGLIAGGVGFYIAIQISLSEMNAEICIATKINAEQNISINKINEVLTKIEQVNENEENIKANQQKLEETKLYFMEIRFNLIKLFKDNNWQYVPYSDLKN